MGTTLKEATNRITKNITGEIWTDRIRLRQTHNIEKTSKALFPLINEIFQNLNP